MTTTERATVMNAEAYIGTLVEVDISNDSPGMGSFPNIYRMILK